MAQSRSAIVCAGERREGFSVSDSAEGAQHDDGDVAESLVNRIGAGDRAAESELVERYRRGLFFVLRKECGDTELAQDLVQDTFVKVIRNAREGRIQKPRALSWYLRRMGVYQLIDLRRKESRRRTSASTEATEAAASESASPLELVDDDQTAGFVRRILEEMTVPRDRELLRRFYLMGQDKQVIASEFEITPEHFDRVKSRALIRLRKLVNEHLGHRGLSQVDLLLVLLCLTGGAMMSLDGNGGERYPGDFGPATNAQGVAQVVSA